MSINSFTFDGVSSEDMGLYVGGQKTFGAPQRDVTKVSIPGRNGDLVRDNGRFLNSEIAYNIVAMNDFKETAQNVRNWLMSAKGYKRLEDTYHPEHYRMARVSGGIDFETGAYNATGKAQILFDCMPQRFLKSGEETSDASMVNRTESGDLFSFEAVAESPINSASVSLSPIQSLNGYDSPWPGGGGKNKLPLDIVNMKAINTNGRWSGNAFTQNGITYTVNDDGTVTVNGTASAISQLVYYDENTDCPFNGYLLNGCPSGGGNTTFDLRVSDVTTSSSSDYGSGTTINLAGTGRWRCIVFVRAGVTVNNIVFKPMIRAAGTDATFAPYSNICPISGHTGAELNRTGINVWDEQWELGTYNTNNGEKYASSAHIRCKNPVSVTPNTSYYFNTNGYNINVCFMDANMAFIDNFNSVHDVVRTTPPNCHYIVFNMAMAYGTTYNNDISINYPATDTEYHAYEGDTYSVTFSDQGTVYGGTYDFVSGKLTVTWISLTMTGNEASVQQTGRVAVKACTGALAKSSGTGQAYCSSFEALASGEWAYIYTSMAVADLMQYLRDNPTQLVYKLATPLEYTLSPQQLTTLQGQNVVWSDAGEITLTYVEPGVIENPTPFDAKPHIRVYGSGTCTVNINNQIITINNVTDFVDIDCETMNCYNGVVNKNADVVLGAQGFPVLPAGKTMIKTGGGTTKIEITPRWWEV